MLNELNNAKWPGNDTAKGKYVYYVKIFGIVFVIATKRACTRMIVTFKKKCETVLTDLLNKIYIRAHVILLSRLTIC